MDQSEQVTRSTVFKNERLTVYEDISMVDGQNSSYTLLDFCDAVFVVAQNPQAKIALITQFRYPTSKVATEIIAGTLPAGVDPIKQAEVELYQEGGLTASRLTRLGHFYMQPSRALNVGHVVHALVDNAEQSTVGNQEADETIYSIDFYSPESVKSMMRDGVIDGAFCVAALGLFFASP